MRFWLRSFLWALLSRPVIRTIPWTDEERKYFDGFCKTSCGMKLFEFLRQAVAGMTFSAVYRDSVNANVANAHARGAQDVLALLHQLRSLPPDELANSETDDDVEPLPSQKGAVDGRRFGSGGFSAITR